MKWIQCMLLFMAGACAASAGPPAGWDTNLTAALESAATDRKPVLVYFTASWCGPCQLMARTTFTNEAVLQALSGVHRVALDIDEHPALAEQHNVRAVPTFEMLSPGGHEVVRTTGYQTPERFVQWLTDAVSGSNETVERQNQFKEKLAAVDQRLALADDGSAREAAVDLFELCAERDAAISQAAVARLKTLALKKPGVLFDGLNHPRLATRIEVANALRARLGDAFDVDPWSDAAVREKAAADWRARLAGAVTSERIP